MSNDVVTNTASYGLELVDALTGRPLIGFNELTITPSAPPPADPTRALTQFSVKRTLWVVENLFTEAIFDITSEYYLPLSLQTNSAASPPAPAMPPVPASGDPAPLVVVTLTPRPGYPFNPTLTRVIGEVRVDASEDPETPLVPGAEVTVTPIYGATTGTDFITLTGEDGQYAAWFEPDQTIPNPDPPYATSYSVSASANVGGTPMTGSIPIASLIRQTFNGAEPIFIKP